MELDKDFIVSPDEEKQIFRFKFFGDEEYFKFNPLSRVTTKPIGSFYKEYIYVKIDIKNTEEDKKLTKVIKEIKNINNNFNNILSSSHNEIDEYLIKAKSEIKMVCHKENDRRNNHDNYMNELKNAISKL